MFLSVFSFTPDVRSAIPWAGWWRRLQVIIMMRHIVAASHSRFPHRPIYDSLHACRCAFLIRGLHLAGCYSSHCTSCWKWTRKQHRKSYGKK